MSIEITNNIKMLIDVRIDVSEMMLIKQLNQKSVIFVTICVVLGIS